MFSLISFLLCCYILLKVCCRRWNHYTIFPPHFFLSLASSLSNFCVHIFHAFRFTFCLLHCIRSHFSAILMLSIALVISLIQKEKAKGKNQKKRDNNDDKSIKLKKKVKEKQKNWKKAKNDHGNRSVSVCASVRRLCVDVNFVQTIGISLKMKNVWSQGITWKISSFRPKSKKILDQGDSLKLKIHKWPVCFVECIDNQRGDRQAWIKYSNRWNSMALFYA